MRHIKVTIQKKYLIISGIEDTTKLRYDHDGKKDVNGHIIPREIKTTRTRTIKLTQPNAMDLYLKLRRYLYV
jgi:hypothetical protein